MADFLCTTCGKTFSRKTSFFNHLSVHKQEPCECKECGKLLKNKKQLANHLDSHRTKTCIGCEKVIPLNSRTHHDCGEPSEKFKCDQCPYEAKHFYENIELNITLKVHVISHHFTQYFELTNSTMKDTNGEFVETLHSSLRIHEEKHGFKIVRKLGTATHFKKPKIP